MFDQVHGICLLDRDLDGKGLLYLIWTMFYMGHVSEGSDPGLPLAGLIHMQPTASQQLVTLRSGTPG